MLFPLRYLPYSLSKKDTKKQRDLLQKSKKLYKKRVFFTRKKLASFTSRPSKHIVRARRLYKVATVTPNRELARATGCSVTALQKIVRKGEGAYYSSGSRPNQTARSWGLARLASSITGGKSAAVDFAILQSGCDARKPAMRLARSSRKKYGWGRSATKHRRTKHRRHTYGG
jgi:hypothetical protein